MTTNDSNTSPIPAQSHSQPIIDSILEIKCKDGSFPIPNRAFEELGIFEYRIFAHFCCLLYARGDYIETVRETAAACKLGASTVSRAKRALIETGWIAGNPRVDPNGYIYLLESHQGIYKIGRTRVPNNRRKTFGVLLPFEVEYAALIKTSDMFRLEGDLHRHYAHKRRGGEWFALDADDVAFIKSLADGVG